MEQLGAQDASYVYLELPNTPMHVGGLAIYDPSTAPGGKVRFKDVLAHIEARLHLAPVFRKKLLRIPGNLDHPYWVEDPDFDLEFHVRHIALPAPGDWRQLCIQAARLFSRGLDMNRPLWEFTVIEGLDGVEGIPKGCFAIVSKVHHAVIDGASGTEINSAIHSLTPDMSPPTKPEHEWHAAPPPSLGVLFLRTYTSNLTHPLRLMRTLAHSVPGMGRVGKGLYNKELSLNQMRPAPRTRFNKSVGPHRVFGALTIPLADIKEIRKLVTGATINDVMLAIVGGALRDYLSGHGELPEASLIAMAPVSIRGENDKGKEGNMVSVMLANLGTNIGDPVERLKFVHSEMNRSKALTQAVGAKTLSEYSALAPGALLSLGSRVSTSLGLASVIKPMANCVVTNVPGPRVPLYFGGAKMVIQHGFGPLTDGVGLIHPIYSYCDVISLAFTADRNVMPDSARYAECLEKAVAMLKGAAEGASPSSLVPDRPKRRRRAAVPAAS